MFVDQVKLQELVISNALTPKFFNRGYQWCETNSGFKWVHSSRYTNGDNILYNLNFNLKRYHEIRFDYSTLKRLSVQDWAQPAHFEFINSLTSLEHLEIYSVSYAGTLSLDRLRVLRIKYVSSFVGRLQINAPQLEVIACKFGFEHWNLSNPESVKQMHLSGDPRRSLEIRKFPNVERVRVDHLLLVSEKLLSLPKLQELRWVLDSYDQFDYFEIKGKFQCLFPLKKCPGQKAKLFCLGEDFDRIGMDFHRFYCRHRSLFTANF